MRVKNSALPGGAFVNQEGNYLRFATGCHSCPALLGGAFWQVFVNQLPNALIDTLMSLLHKPMIELSGNQKWLRCAPL